MPTVKTKPQAIDLGELQRRFAETGRALVSAEKALLRAQESRDSAQVEAQASAQALRDATRVVLG